jgi:hypothetical protein
MKTRVEYFLIGLIGDTTITETNTLNIEESHQIRADVKPKWTKAPGSQIVSTVYFEETNIYTDLEFCI